MEKATLIEQLKGQIIVQLNLEGMQASDIDPEGALFGDGLGLDSIDALELIVLLEKEYGIKIEDPKEGKKIFHSVNTLADYILANQTN
jgi:acyl carrier protein